MLSWLNEGPESPREFKIRKLYLDREELKPFYKFHMKNGIAYTEDHIPVQKLHLFGMPMELTQDALLDYFTQNYGDVLGIERIEASVPDDEEEELLPTWNALALFGDARNAAKVLQVSEHMIRSYGFYVQACYSWLQPVAHEESNELEFAKSPLILKLNDDFLEQVFQYLSLADQIRLARTCLRFRNIYQTVSARLHKSVNSRITEALTLWEVRDFCQLSGQHVEKLSFCSGFENFRRCFYAGLHFPNLKELEVKDEELKVHKLQPILQGTIKLKKLTLRTYPRTDRLELAHLKDLKKLDISEWNTESLSLPTSIESLTLSHWSNTSCLPSILKDHTQIKKLQIGFSKNIFNEMVKSQAFASVEVLSLFNSDYDVKKLFEQLPKLKKFYLGNYWRYPGEIIKHIPQQLDHFEICFPKQVLKREVLQIVRLTGLHTLALGHPRDFDGEVISEFGQLTELKRFDLLESRIFDGLLVQLLINCPMSANTWCTSSPVCCEWTFKAGKINEICHFP